jgi:hypothetical protein
MLAVVLADFVNGNDVRMIETGGRFGFGVKTLLQCERGQVPGQNHLERDGPIQAHLSSAINHAHPAAGDLFEQFVIAKVANMS